MPLEIKKNQTERPSRRSRATSPTGNGSCLWEQRLARHLYRGEYLGPTSEYESILRRVEAPSFKTRIAWTNWIASPSNRLTALLWQ